MHGVGYRFVKQLLDHFHIPPCQVVEAQIDPDPTFPTVSFPNPEEKGVEEPRECHLGVGSCAENGGFPRVAVCDGDGPGRGPFHLCGAIGGGRRRGEGV